MTLTKVFKIGFTLIQRLFTKNKRAKAVVKFYLKKDVSTNYLSKSQSVNNPKKIEQ